MELLQAKLLVAQDLLRNKEYDAARIILQTIQDNVTAQKWLEKLGTLNSLANPRQFESPISLINSLPDELDALKHLLLGKNYYELIINMKDKHIAPQFISALQSSDETTRKTIGDILIWLAYIINWLHSQDAHPFWDKFEAFLGMENKERAGQLFGLYSAMDYIDLEIKQAAAYSTTIEVFYLPPEQKTNHKQIFQVRGHSKGQLFCVVEGNWEYDTGLQEEVVKLNLWTSESSGSELTVMVLKKAGQLAFLEQCKKDYEQQMRDDIQAYYDMYPNQDEF
jgi:hypothetical protein